MVNLSLVIFFICYSSLQLIRGERCSNGSLKDFSDDFIVLKSASGRPIGDKLNALTAGSRGPMLLQDSVFIEETAHFNREKIPSRSVHGKGHGAFGYFEVTNDVTRYSKAKLFSRVGKRTHIAVRFSMTTGMEGSSDTVRDVRGIAIKFYTEEGNWDLLGLHSPVFVLRDPLMFPSFVRALKPEPAANLKLSSEAAWDFFSLRPETTATILYVYSDNGIPQSYRHINGFALNTFKLVNSKNEKFYCRFIYLTDQGVKNMPNSHASELAGSNPDFHGIDLFKAIEDKNYPSWTLHIQVMTEKEAKHARFNIFDATKEWPKKDFPYIRVGKLVLNRNPKDYFAEVEQLAFSPGNLVPGIEPSADKVLQGRIFAYSDAQRYRLGSNFQQIPVNYPFKSPPNNYERNGEMVFARNQADFPNYYPNSYGGPVQDPLAQESLFDVCGMAARFDTSEEDNFSQARIFYKELDLEERQRMVENLAESLQSVSQCILHRLIKNFEKVDRDFGRKILKTIMDNKMKN